MTAPADPAVRAFLDALAVALARRIVARVRATDSRGERSRTSPNAP